MDSAAGEYTTVFRGRKNPYTSGRGTLGEYAAVLSAWVMTLPDTARDGCAAIVMQIMESLQGTKTGLNGEKLKLSDFLDFSFLGIPVIAGSLLWGEEGRNFLGAATGKVSFTEQLQGKINLEIDPEALAGGRAGLEQAAFRISNLTGQIRESAGEIPTYMKGSMELYRKLRLVAETMEKLEKKLKQMIQIQEEIECNYRKWEEQAEQTAAEAIAFCREIQ